MPLEVNGTGLSAQEFRDALLLRYGTTPPDLPHRCDGCGACFSVEHALQCKKGGLVTARHNELRDELGSLAAMAFTPKAVCNEPMIHTGYVAEGIKVLSPLHWSSVREGT